MDMEISDLHQKAVLCTIEGRNNYGEMTRSAGIEISVRWEEKQAERLDAQGNVIKTDAVVIVDRAVDVGSLLWLGLLEDFDSDSADLKQVISYDNVPDVKNRATRRQLTVMKYGDSLPVLA